MLNKILIKWTGQNVQEIIPSLEYVNTGTWLQGQYNLSYTYKILCLSLQSLLLIGLTLWLAFNICIYFILLYHCHVFLVPTKISVSSGWGLWEEVHYVDIWILSCMVDGGDWNSALQGRRREWRIGHLTRLWTTKITNLSHLAWECILWGTPAEHVFIITLFLLITTFPLVHTTSEYWISLRDSDRTKRKKFQILLCS
jgi:hypothetical protein